jgi:hypothetical protein
MMVTELKQTAKNLYETDYNLWVKETATLLEARSFNGLDLENLIEEILDLSERKKRKLESLLTRLWEHLLKLKYWQSEKDYNENHWKREVRNFRKQINKEFQVSPSLHNYLQEIFQECYQDAKELVSDISGLSLAIFPVCPFISLEETLKEDWLP